MTDLIEYVRAMGDGYGIDDPKFGMNVSKFFVSNNWFGGKPTIENGRIFVDDVFLERISTRIDEFCANYQKDNSGKLVYLIEKLVDELPKTGGFLKRYIKAVSLDETSSYHLADFLLYNLAGELDESTDTEVGDLMDCGYDDLPKVYGDILADFVNWVKLKTRTVYQNVYYMNEYTSKEEATDAYDPHSYLKILFHLFNEDYVSENDMYAKAAVSKNYTDTWLFLSLHFLCALRNTDLIRIPHPRLYGTPQETLDQIENGTFSEETARMVLNTVVWHLDVIMLTPNKTSGISGVPSIKIHIPESVEVHMGTLFAAAEAHFQKNKMDLNKPLVRVITTYEQINRYMGEEIGDLFLDANFRSRAANKSYMQMIFLLTDDILDVNDEFRVKGYMLAALARSHKGAYGDFAKTTSIYLKDAKMSGYTPEFVAREMFERGVLSLIPSMLLKMITGGEYQKLSVESQTKMIQELNLSPQEIEQSVALMQVNVKRSLEVAKAVYQKNTREDILKILHRIGNGEAVSKCDGCLCLVTAMGKVCPFPDNQNCPGCEYEISTKTTMYLMVQEYRRLMNLYALTNSEVEKKRYKAMAKNVIIPSIEEMLAVVEERFGREGIISLEKIISEGP